MATVFISYSHEDTIRARQLAMALTDMGHSVWWDRRLRAGEDWNATLEKRLTDSDAVVVVWSSASITSRFVRDEAGRALAMGKLVPVTLDSVTPPLGFGHLHAIDLSRWLGGNDVQAIVELSEAIEQITRMPGATLEVKPPRGLRFFGFVLGGKFYGLAFGALAFGILGAGAFFIFKGGELPKTEYNEVSARQGTIPEERVQSPPSDGALAPTCSIVELGFSHTIVVRRGTKLCLRNQKTMSVVDVGNASVHLRGPDGSDVSCSFRGEVCTLPVSVDGYRLRFRSVKAFSDEPGVANLVIHTETLGDIISLRQGQSIELPEFDLSLTFLEFEFSPLSGTEVVIIKNGARLNVKPGGQLSGKPKPDISATASAPACFLELENATFESQKKGNLVIRLHKFCPGGSGSPISPPASDQLPQPR